MLNQLDFEEKKSSKVKLVTRIYSNFILKYPIVPILLSFIISAGLIVLSCYLYGMWPTCNSNYYHWSGDDISEKWLSYLASTKNTYASLHKLLTTSFSIPYQFDLAQAGAIFYQRRNTKKLNKDHFLTNKREPHINNSNTDIFNQNDIRNLNRKPNHQNSHNNNISKQEIDDSENVLTLESLRAIWDVEEKMHQTKGWIDYCYKVPKDILATFMQPFLDELLDYMKDHLSELEEDTKCLAFKSIITEFKSYMRKKLNISNPKSSDLTNEIIYNYIHGYDESNRSIEKRLKMTYFGTDYNNMKTTLIRSLVLSGHPVKGYNSKSDRFYEQRKIIGKWQVEFLKPLYDQINNISSPLYPSAAFPYEIEYEIFDIVLQHLPYFGGAVLILIILVCIAFKSIFLGVFGMVGALFSILLSVSVVNIIFQLHYFDVLFSMALFMSCILLNLCNLFIYQTYKNNKSFLYIVEKTTKTMIVALLINSFTFLPTLYFGTKVGQYFGFYCFILGLNSFVLVFTWYLPLLSLYSKVKTKKFKTESLYSLNTILLTSVDEDSTNFALSQASNTENTNDKLYKNFPLKKSSSATLIHRDQNSNHNYTNSKSVSDFSKANNNNNNDSELNSESNNIETNSQTINTTSASFSNSNTSTNIFSYAETLEDYPHQNLFDFFKMKATFNINCCNQFPQNFIEKLFCYHIWPFIYFYRAIFVFICLILLSTNIYFVSQIETKSGISFLKKTHRIQRALDTATNGFMNPLNDNAFVYVWGLNKKSSKPYKSWIAIDDYGYHKSFNNNEVNLDMITDSRTQSHIMETWEMLMNQTDIIDSYQSEYFGFNPWEVWDMIANADLGPFSFIFKFLNFTEPPTNVSCITPEQYHSYLFVWQLLLSLKTMQEADNYVPGTLFRNTIGFSYTDYNLQFIGMKANMFLTKHNNKKELKIQYNRAKELEKIIQDEAVKKGIPDFKGWMTSAAWIPLAVEENITKNTLIIFFTSLILTIFGPLLFVSYKMSVVVFIGSFGSIIFTFGTLKISFDWKLGLNEALMIAVSNGFASVFLQISVFDAFSKSNKKLPKFGKIQIALTNSAIPLLVILLLLLLSIPILMFCPFQLFPPFTIFLFFDGLYCVLWGIIISPIILYCIL